MKPSSQIHLGGFVIFLFCFISRCSAQTPASNTNALPQFSMWPGDIGVKQSTRIIPPSPAQTNYTVRFFLDYHEHSELRKFTREHLHQRVQFVLEGKIVGELYLINEIPDGSLELPVKSREEADWIAREFNHG